jgi:glycosyltransferase involved in cell wall biosynthesis
VPGKHKQSAESPLKQEIKGTMRIALLIDTLSSGGAQRQLVLLAKSLKLRGHEVAVCVYSNGRFYSTALEEAGVELVEINSGSRWEKLFGVYRWLRKWRPQVLQAFLIMPGALAELTSFLPHTWKIVVSERNVEPFPFARRSRVLGRLVRQLHRRADWITTNSHANKELMIQDMSFLEAKTSVVWNMVDMNRFCKSTLTKNQSKEDGIVRFLCVASMYHHKNGPKLIKALRILKERNILNFHLRWVGRYEPKDLNNFKAYKEVMNLVREYKLENYFEFVGEKQDVLCEYRRADALVLVSLIEGLPNAVCEAMACGLPLVLSNVSDHAKIIGEMSTGFLCSPHEPERIADALQAMISLPAEQRFSMGQRARKTAEIKFDGDKFVDEYEAIYRRVIDDAVKKASAANIRISARQ